MFKIYSPRFLVAAVAWATVMVVLLLNGLKPLLSGAGLSVGFSLQVAIVQFIFTLFFVTPIWRVVWRRLPKLNDWIYPDLNGDWDVELKSNWPRIDALLKSANGEASAIDMRKGDEAALPPLTNLKMKARITQSWITMDMELWNPASAGPIRESKTLIVEPFRAKSGRHGLTYVFEQSNDTDVVSDDSKFRGAAWIERDRDDPNVLCGRMWSDRMWRRGMNTAAELRFTRQVVKVRSRRSS
jgi:hypothetical protein